MSQLVFKFPFKTSYFQKNFYVSSNNFEAYKLIESYPDWPDKWINIYGPNGCGKTHLCNIIKKKISSIYSLASHCNESMLSKLEKFKCIIIDDYKSNIDEGLLFSIINQSKQFNTYLVITTKDPIKNLPIKLTDLKSRLDSFIGLGIELPTDELLKVVISKHFSDKQVEVSSKNLEYIIKNIDRSYEKAIKFVKDIDNLSLSSGKSININLIKKVINNE